MIPVDLWCWLARLKGSFSAEIGTELYSRFVLKRLKERQLLFRKKLASRNADRPFSLAQKVTHLI